MKSSDRVRQTVVGVVTPCDWDDTDNVTAVAIATADEKEYVVTNKYAIRRLLRHLDKLVEATGLVQGNEYGEEIFAMEEFRKAERDDEWDEEWEEDEDDLEGEDDLDDFDEEEDEDDKDD